ncbi:M20 family metallopeptidase [Arenicella xantha]|uniref:Glutamate carboxypeptidase n=1 Tax=Arenicella xantha TaxID=644221 RepID=A0A395JM44_9GAMM|nr:M20 family metallopeptidase [Arenicella xantha]RBP52711.1 glutamate carboxypeptidase [Arenicella xantha]
MRHRLAIAGLVFAASTFFNPAMADDSSGDVTPNKTVLSTNEQAMVEWIDGQQANMLAELKAHVELNTGTDNIVGLNQYREILAAELSRLGFTTETVDSDPIATLSCDAGNVEIAPHLVAKLRATGGRQILLNGHMDTVFSNEDEFQTLQVDPDGTLHGPGVADMKGGIVVMLTALRALSEQGLLDHANLTVLLNSDEEIGSLGSRELIEALAQQHDVGMVFEGTSANQFTRARKGLGQVRLKVIGRESHAGGAHADGVSANLELAHKIIDIEALTDYSSNVTVNAGVMRGGEKRNTVAGCADAYIDLRFPSQSEGERLVAEINRITATASVQNERFPNLPTIESWSVLHRPVKAQDDQVDKLIADAMGISSLVGAPIVGTRYSGGGTDGSIAQNVGLPTVDSLGVDGTGAHSSREQSSLQSLLERAKLAAILLAREISGAAE